MVDEQDLINAFYEDIKPKSKYHSHNCVGYQLETLPEPYRTQAINNTVATHGEAHLEKINRNTLRHMLTVGMISFSWEHSLEGFEYWHHFVEDNLR